jgi:hypothetical protein
MDNIQEYYQILGISAQASLDELKQAYRIKAKQLHPDRNKSAQAHDEFILLNEAYEYLLNKKTGKIATINMHSHYTDWVTAEREKAKAKAREYARMQYEEFINSDHYRSLTSISAVIDSLYILFGAGLFIGLPIFISWHYGPTGFIASLMVVLLLFPLIRQLIRNHVSKDAVKNTMDALLYLIRTRWFLTGVITLFNILILIRIGMQTLITPSLLFSVLLLSILITSAAVNYILVPSKKSVRWFYPLCIAPLCISLLLSINYIGSSNYSTETYYFNTSQSSKEHSRESTYIHLDYDQYEDYPGIRIFWDYSVIQFNNTITYTFKEGLFGIRVMTDYRFTNNLYLYE